MYLCVTDQHSTMNSCKCNTKDLLAKSLALICFIFNNMATGGTIYSEDTHLNGVEGTNITIIFFDNTSESENYTAQIMKDGKNFDETSDDRFTLTREDRKFLLHINFLQGLDKGNYSIKYGHTISDATFLNIIEIPSSDYPKIQLKRVSKDQLAILCVSEKTSPRPNLSINREVLGVKENATYIWVMKTVDIKANMTEVDYTCLLEVPDFPIKYAKITGPQITEFLASSESTNPSISWTTNKAPTNSTSDDDDDSSTIETVSVICGLAVFTLIVTVIYRKRREVLRKKGAMNMPSICPRVTVHYLQPPYQL